MMLSRKAARKSRQAGAAAAGESKVSSASLPSVQGQDAFEESTWELTTVREMEEDLNEAAKFDADVREAIATESSEDESIVTNPWANPEITPSQPGFTWNPNIPPFIPPFEMEQAETGKSAADVYEDVVQQYTPTATPTASSGSKARQDSLASLPVKDKGDLITLLAYANMAARYDLDEFMDIQPTLQRYLAEVGMSGSEYQPRVTSDRKSESVFLEGLLGKLERQIDSVKMKRRLSRSLLERLGADTDLLRRLG